MKLLALAKIRSFSKSNEQLWLDEWVNPLAREIQINDPNEFIANLQRPVSADGLVSDEIVLQLLLTPIL